jgi:hypothetical protein
MRLSRHLVLSSLFFTAIACSGPNKFQKITAVRILSPFSATAFGNADDLNGSDPGLAILAVAAVFIDDGFGGEKLARDGITVRLRTNQQNDQFADTENGQAYFNSFPLLTDSTQPSVVNSLQACVIVENNRELCSEAVVVETDIVGPPCNIVDPADGTILDEIDDADLNLLNGFQLAEAIVSTDAGDGTQVLLNVNDTQAGASVVQGSVARFVQVKLETGQNTLDVKCLDRAGNTGVGTSSVSVAVTLPSISITEPAPNTTISSNVSPASFSVKTHSTNVEPGQLVTLLLDGATIIGPAATDTSGNAAFAVQLGEGTHTLKAQTQDLAGTPAESLIVTVNVDVISQAPVTAFVLPSCASGSLQLFSGDDIDNDTSNGIQTQVLASSTGTDVDLLVTPTTGPLFADSRAVVGGLVQFPSVTFKSGTSLLALTSRDTATGLTGTPVTCNVEVVDDDFLTIVEPTNGAVLSLADDLDGDSSNGLQIRARVSGSSGIANGTTITFQVNGTTDQIKQMNNGLVTFEGADAITLTGEGTFTLTAQGPGSIVPATITVTVDIPDQPPTVDLLVPDCSSGSIQLFSTDDLDNDASNGVQIDILGASDGTDVDLVTIAPGGASLSDSKAVFQGFVQFSSVTFLSGSNSFSLTPRHTGTGLTGAAVSCNVEVFDDDVLTIVEPTNGAILGLFSDADGNAANGLQVQARVTGTAGIANGTNIDFQVNGVTVQTKAMNNGQVLFNGVDLIPLTVEGSVTLTAEGPGTIDPSSITVIVDTKAPNQVTDLSCDLIDHRQGTGTCHFTAPQDPTPGTGIASYEVRLLENVAIDNTNFASAKIVATPSFVGGTETVNLSGLRIGPTYHVALLSIDQAGNHSLASNDAVVKVNGVAGPVTFSSVTVHAVVAGSSFGSVVDAAGDLNNDGIDDLIVSAPFAQSPKGETYIYYGTAQDPSLTFVSPSATIVGVGGFAGVSLSSIGDFNGDGIPDFAIGEPFGGIAAVYVFLGRGGTLAISGTHSVLEADLIIHNDPANVGSNFGISIAGGGDVDGDGRDDLVIGANKAAGPGAAYLVYGQNLPTQQNITFPTGIGQEFRGITNNDRFASGLSPVGDLNNDGFDDLVIGATEINSSGPGYVAVFLGGPRPTIPPIGINSLTRNNAFAVLTGLAQGVDFGALIAGVGSLDGDDTPSLLVADRNINGSSGNVYLFDDITPGTTNAQTALTIEKTTSFADLLGNSAAASVSFGGSVFDVDNDGFSDVLVGESKTQGVAPGSAYLFYGNSNFFDNSPLDPTVDSAGAIVPVGLSATSVIRFVGDINGDGFVDFVIGDSAAPGGGAFQLFF